MDALKDRLLREARDQGFSAARICRPEAVPEELGIIWEAWSHLQNDYVDVGHLAQFRQYVYVPAHQDTLGGDGRWVLKELRYLHHLLHLSLAGL